MFFNILADATDENTELGAQTVNTAHRTHNSLLNALGFNDLIPAPIQNATDAAFNASERTILSGEHGAPALLRGGSTSGHHSDRNLGGEQPGEDEDDGQSENNLYNVPATFMRPHDVDFIMYWPREVYNQGKMMSCVARAVAGAFEYGVCKKLHTEFDPSRLFIWYNARSVSATPKAVRMNIGVNLRDALNSLKASSHGVCSEQDWPYEVAEYHEKSRYYVPGAKAAKSPPRKWVGKLAFKHTANYYSVCRSKKNQLLPDLLKCLNEKYPFVFLMKTYKLLDKLKGPDFKLSIFHLHCLSNSQTDFLHRIANKRDNANGEHTHSLTAVGYNKHEKVFTVRNSRGNHWGDQGHFKIPFSYLPHCYEFWTWRVVATL